VLRHERYLSGDLAASVLARRAAVDEHRAGARREHPVDQIEQRALAAAVGPHHAHEIAGSDLERQILEHRPLGVIGI
jgi:hypothetical protein